ncbi:MAG: amino acid adenylation domain-containing protein [Thermoleophilia bacterium]
MTTAISTTSTGVHAGFLRSVERFPDRPALWVEGATLTYAELYDRAAAIAATLQRHDAQQAPLTAVFGYRSATAFAGVLGALLSGTGYVPLKRTFPAARNAQILGRSGARAVIVDEESLLQLDEVLAGAAGPVVVLAPDVDAAQLAGRWPGHVVLGREDVLGADALEPSAPSPDEVAYVLFTSGSTGTPKGVTVSHANAQAFVEAASERYGLTEHDRLSQMFDMTFDLSVFDMFVGWSAGASLHCAPPRALLKPDAYIREQELTVFFCVPSTGAIMRKLGLLKPGAFPDVRYTLFCGEPLPQQVATAFRAAFPNAILENVYGPTEVTVVCAAYRWDDERSPGECLHGVVPIGDFFGTTSGYLADDQLRPVAPGADGELLLAGPQVSLGYWRDPERTAPVFVVPPGESATHYRTGDLVRPGGPGEPMRFISRIDNQVKIQGNRVELGEIEEVLRRETGVDAVVVLGWPRTDSGFGGVEAFVGSESVDADAARAALAGQLPGYMVPRRIHRLASLPLNDNGKYDRRALRERLEAGL